MKSNEYLSSLLLKLWNDTLKKTFDEVSLRNPPDTVFKDKKKKKNPKYFDKYGKRR